MTNFGNRLALFSRLIERKKKSCTLTVKSDSNVGNLYFRNGELVEAIANRFKGKEAVLNIILWDKIECELKKGCKFGEKKPGFSLSQLLLESGGNTWKSYGNILEHGMEDKVGKEEVIMSTVWDALVKIKEGQGEENEMGIIEESVSGPKVIKEELESDTQSENEKKLEDFNMAETAENTERGPSRIIQLNKVLAGLKTISNDIEACAVASEDGLIMASNLPAGLEESNVAAMCAVMLSMGERTSAELDRGNAQQLFIKGDAGYVVAMRAGNHAVLLVMARKEAKLGLVFLDISRAAAEVEQILS